MSSRTNFPSGTDPNDNSPHLLISAIAAEFLIIIIKFIIGKPILRALIISAGSENYQISDYAGTMTCLPA
jgi:hypothetical protein